MLRNAAVLLLLASLNPHFSAALAQGTAFTYQGQLQNGGSPANGSFDVKFTLFVTTNEPRSAWGGPVTNLATAVTNGLFTTLVDFGPGIFIGETNWLEIAVRTNGGGAFAPLTPDQQVTPTPYALTAGSAGGLAGLTIQQYSSGAPNLIAGAADNSIASGVLGATIAGGSNNTIAANSPFAGLAGGVNNGIGTGSPNAWLGGGGNNTIANYSPYAFIGGGYDNTIQAYSDHAFIGGGGYNVIQGSYSYAGSYSAIVGGDNNGITLGSFYSFIGGGSQNTIQNNAYFSALAGGNDNSIGGVYSFIGAGLGNSVQTGGTASVLGGGFENTIQASVTESFLGGGDANKILSGATYAVLGGGIDNAVGGSASTVAGGQDNTASATTATVGGGYGNNATANSATVGGGFDNTASNIVATVGGGYNNLAISYAATVPGGAYNVAGGMYAFAAGQQAQATNQGAFVWADSQGAPFASANNDSFNVRAQGGVHLVTSGAGLTVDGQPVVAGSGGTNENTYFGTGAGQTGNNNTGIGYEALYVVAGFASGSDNTAIGVSALLLNNGSDNTANGYSALYANGGSGNTANGFSALYNNSGSDNTADGYDALLYNHASYNTANGYEAMGGASFFTPPTGGYNTAHGAFALFHDTSGANNVADGANALAAGTTGSENTAIGASALGNSTTDSGLVAVGYQALQNDNAGNNQNSLSGNGENTAIGFQAGQQDNSGYGNSALGYHALQNDNAGYQNTAIGDLALVAVTSGYGNIAVGYQAGSETLGNYNIDIGSLGSAGDNNVIRIGSGQSQLFLSGTLQGALPINGGLNVDSTGQNAGDIHANSLTFGASSGEGVLSKRSGNYAYDVELWTDFTERMKVAQNGYVGINTDNPQTHLDVGGTVTAEGLNVNGTATVNGPANINGTATVQVLQITGGSDVAEPFDLSSPDVPKGSVLVIDNQHPGELKVSRHAYDKCVAGIVSGANGVNPGLTLNQSSLSKSGRAVALTGRVYTLADATAAPIEPGDLLTTSDTEGHAMKVTDPTKAQGAVLGKAMSSLATGRGYVLVLVTLQ